MTTAEAARLWGEHHASLIRVAARLVGPDDAPDAVQDTFVLALRSGTSPADPGPWLRTVCRNRCRDVLRSRAARLRWGCQPDPLNADGDDQVTTAAGREPTPDEHAIAADLAGRVEQVIGWFGEDAGLVRLALAGVPQAAVARRFGCSVRTVKARMNSFRRQVTA